jgi:hypothetical protein
VGDLERIDCRIHLLLSASLQVLGAYRKSAPQSRCTSFLDIMEEKIIHSFQVDRPIRCFLGRKWELSISMQSSLQTGFHCQYMCIYIILVRRIMSFEPYRYLGLTAPHQAPEPSGNHIIYIQPRSARLLGTEN